ncbi:MAG: hypothetical protein H7343_21400 [Undibacterium sp.]|nr:hypothetical protein [Opitutaceae bacterium]
MLTSPRRPTFVKAPRLLVHAALTFALFSSAVSAQTAVSPALEKFAAARNLGLPALAYDLTRATVVAPTAATGPEKKAVAMLIEDTESRTLVRWPLAAALPAPGQPVIVVGRFAEVRALLGARASEAALDESKVGAEGYQLSTLGASGSAAPVIVIAGRDARGVLFGVGHLLRTLHLGPARAGLLTALNLATTPHYALRGHQLAYRPKPNSYSGWDLPQWERYIRDLAIFGCNAIELLPPRTDDDADSPHFPRPQLDMMVGMSRLAADYGLDVWIWYPAMDDDYGKPETVAFALKEWAEVFSALPRIDAILVPGGDPGHTPPRLMFPLLEKQTASLRRFHPQATMWLSPQGFGQDDMDYFINYLTEQKPAWLAGAVFAPWVHMDLAEFRRRVPAAYPIRYYPDITHTRNCQYPIADWDRAFVLTQTREPVSTRPTDMARILRLLQPHTIGAVTYSEGCIDDINKTVWSRLSWDPDASLTEILRDYGRYFISERLADDFAQGIFALERNWRGPLLAHEEVYTTLAQFQAMERAATPRDLQNWRFQMALYRAYFDATVRARLIHETALEAAAMDVLRTAPALGAAHAMARAEEILTQAVSQPAAPAWRTRTYQLAEALFQSIHLKLSVPLYRAIAQGRGASLDTLDYPLNNRAWLAARFAAIRPLDAEPARLAQLHEIVNWTNPGPGGFYDDLGNAAASPHLDRGLGYERDPAFLKTPLDGHVAAGALGPLPLRTSWIDFAWGLNDNAVTMNYADLDPTAEYRVRAVYPDVRAKAKIRLVANGNVEVHPFISRPNPIAPVAFDLPRAATATGKLTLTWTREPGLGGNGSGCSISEVWLEKKTPTLKP